MAGVRGLLSTINAPVLDSCHIPRSMFLYPICHVESLICILSCICRSIRLLMIDHLQALLRRIRLRFPHGARRLFIVDRPGLAIKYSCILRNSGDFSVERIREMCSRRLSTLCMSFLKLLQVLPCRRIDIVHRINCLFAPSALLLRLCLNSKSLSDGLVQSRRVSLQSDAAKLFLNYVRTAGCRSGSPN